MRFLSIYLTVAGLSILALSTCSHGETAAEPRVHIGIYDVVRANGSGYSTDAILAQLRRYGWQADAFTDLTFLSLMRYNIVYLSDMHSPGPAPGGWQGNIRRYVSAGGSVLQTWHHHILGSVSTGVKRVYGKQLMRPVPNHPVLGGISEFSAVYRDHIREQVGAAGTVVMENEFGDPVKLALHVVLARKAGAAGFCGFCYVPEHTGRLFAPLVSWLERGIE